MENACSGQVIVNAEDYRDINPGDRILMGPGPSDVHSRTLPAMAALETVLGTEEYQAQPGALEAATAVYDETCRVGR